MATIDLAVEPVGSAYVALLDAALMFCTELRFITFDRWQMTERAADLVERLKPWLTAEEIVTTWPGTQLGPGWTARLWRVHLVPEVVRVLLDVTSGFEDWGGDLPEDPHLVRADGTPFLGSSSSEEDVWLELHDSEEATIRAVPEIQELLTS